MKQKESVRNRPKEITGLPSIIRSSYMHKLLSHDPYTYYHSLRVASLLSTFSAYIGFSSEECEASYNAGLLHDIGKLNVCKSILSKPDVLTAEEWKQILCHPSEGINLLSKPLHHPTILEITKHHHENYNGSGYPDGLKGDSIPYTARIARIIDSFDAMTSQRSYNKRKSIQSALVSIEDNIGNAYDPTIAKEFIIFVEKKNHPLFRKLI
ncbi:HD domain-containing phosphohydrolase [Bacillus sp. SM2101]|uniref:HD-GYP domain-containing protein n=1 Tax=Bacillus sp. SM2101 TaxID=2805366 RepID=UPI001BDDCB58|nr:HD domain-containing phosphohydrolase [Bacillus sp. SM2101]